MTLPITEPQAPPGSAQAAPPPMAANPGLPPAPGGRLIQAWRQWRVLAALIALIVLACVLAVLVAPPPKSNTYLDPASSDPGGTNALAAILAQRGFKVTSVY